MKQKSKRILALLISAVLVLTGVFPVFAANSPEIDSYIDSTYAKAIDPYGNLQKDENERYIIPLSKTSISLKKDSYSSLYTAVWSSSDESYAKITNYSSSASAKITHPTAAVGDKEITLTLTLTDKNNSSKICAKRDYKLIITAQLPVYALTVTAKNVNADEIPNASIMVQDSRNISVRPSNGIYNLIGSTEYTVTVSAKGYIRNIQKVTLNDDKNLEIVLEQGANVNFNVKTVSGSTADYATIKVTSALSGEQFSPVLDEYGYETSSFELKSGEYKYDITYQNGSQNSSGTFIVLPDDEILEIPVQLKNTEYKIKFDVEPKDADISLYKNGASGAYGDPVLPDADGYYTIVFGQYRYTVEAENFETVSKTFNATDTSLKNNGYVITVRLKSPYDKILSDADSILFDVSGEGLVLNEYSGLHSDIDFGYYADIDSDYNNVNIKDTIETYINNKLNSDEHISTELLGVENEDYEEDYSVIDKDGIIHYNAVTDDILNFDETGAEFTVKLKLLCKNRELESEVTVIVPKHITSRQERLDDAAVYACDFEKIKGNNTNIEKISSKLELTDISSNLENDFTYYSICTEWSSDHPDIINPKTGEITQPENDTKVTLSVKAYYSTSQIEEAGFLFDPGPLGENQSVRTITLVVTGKHTNNNTQQPPAVDISKPGNVQDNNSSVSDKNPSGSVSNNTETENKKTSQTENPNQNTNKRSPNTGNDIPAATISAACALFISTAFITLKKRKTTIK